MLKAFGDFRETEVKANMEESNDDNSDDDDNEFDAETIADKKNVKAAQIGNAVLEVRNRADKDMRKYFVKLFQYELKLTASVFQVEKVRNCGNNLWSYRTDIH